MENQILLYLGAIISLLAYVPLAKVVKENPASHSYIAFLLYAIFDSITGISIYNENSRDGSWLLMLAYVFGSLYIAISIYIETTKVSKIDDYEKIIIFFIIICLIIWILSGNQVTTIVSNTLAIMAGAFEAKKLWKNPDKKSTLVWVIFLIGATITFFAGKGWDLNSFIEERLCALTNALESIVFIYLSTRKKVLA